MTIREALRKLYTAMCGGTTNKNTAGDLINAIATDYTGGGGGSLPTPGNVGNVLTSTGEAWESAAPADNEMVITADLDMSDFSIGNFSEERFSRIESAFLAGKNVHLIVNVLDEPTLNARLAFRSDDVLIFVTETMLDDDDYRYAMWVVTDHEPLVGTAYIYNHLPNVSGGDNGKILGVDNGEYALVDPTAPVYFNFTESSGTVTLSDNATVKDIYDARQAEKTVYLHDSGTGFDYLLTGVLYDDQSVQLPYQISAAVLKYGITKIVASSVGIGGVATASTGTMIEADLMLNV